MALDWYPFYPTEFRRDTYHLCAAADGIYRRLIDEYMLTRLPLPAHASALAGIARVTPEEFNAHSAVLMAFFREKDGKLFHKRCEQELHAQSMLAASRSKKAKEAATIRWGKQKQKQLDECYEHARSNANAMLNHATLHNIDVSLTTSERGGGSAKKPTDEQKQAALLACSDELKELLTRRKERG